MIRDHIKLVEKAANAPYACALTGSNEGRMVELGYGRVTPTEICLYLAEKVAQDVAEVIGWIPPEAATELRENLAAAVAENDRLRAELAETGVDSDVVRRAEAFVGALRELILPEESAVEGANHAGG